MGKNKKTASERSEAMRRSFDRIRECRHALQAAERRALQIQDQMGDAEWLAFATEYGCSTDIFRAFGDAGA